MQISSYAWKSESRERTGSFEREGIEIYPNWKRYGFCVTNEPILMPYSIQVLSDLISLKVGNGMLQHSLLATTIR